MQGVYRDANYEGNMKTRQKMIEALELVRQSNGHSMEKVAQEIGVAYQTVWLWLRRDQSPTLKHAQKIERYCKAWGAGKTHKTKASEA